MERIQDKSNKQYSNPSWVKNTAMLLCLCFIMLSYLSTAYIQLHANHEHNHDAVNGSCTTCIHIASAESLLKQLSSAILTSEFVLVLFLFICCFLKSYASCTDFSTLITLKVRLNI